MTTKKNIYIIPLLILAIISFAILLTQKDVFSNIQENLYKEPPYLNIREVDVKPFEITSSFVNINITAYINHRGGKTNNASMVIRAIDSSTGLLNVQASTPFETSSENVEKTMTVFQNLKIDKNGNYNLKILLFDNGSILDSGSVNVQGINILTPESKKSGITMSNIDFNIGGVSSGKVMVRPDIYLENTGSESSDNLKLIIKARQAESNILADKTNAETGSIGSEKTSIKEVQLTVPDEYNYMVVVELWKDDTMINSWEKPLLLAPTKTVPKESQEKKVNIEVSQFVRETGAVPGVTSMVAATPPQYAGQSKTPGFEIFGSILAFLIVLIVKRKKW
jgi:hypothetical protein